MFVSTAFRVGIIFKLIHASDGRLLEMEPEPAVAEAWRKAAYEKHQIQIWWHSQVIYVSLVKSGSSQNVFKVQLKVQLIPSILS